MNIIKLLDQQTINKIAAGEVVERPSSVVKELVENSIDAKSSAITVEIKDGGTSYIRITDNGVGIPKEQVRTAFLRHSTSKIKDAYDLTTIGTLGFRGEALASIAAVAKVEMMTKTRESLTGIRIVIEGGKIVSEEEIGCPEGTTIIIRNLFFNTPARKKFLKRPATESAYISDLINRIALGHTAVSFKYMNNGKVSLHTAGNNDLKSCIFQVYGKSMINEMIEVSGENNDIKVIGFIGKPVLSRGNKTYESYYINGRYIKSKIIEKAIHDAYKDFIPTNNYPVVIIHFEINPKVVDVNVHPTKMEVRFENEEEIYQMLYDNICNRLKSDNLIPEIKLEKEKSDKPIIKEYVKEAFEIENNNLRPSIIREDVSRFSKQSDEPLINSEAIKSENIDNNIDVKKGTSNNYDKNNKAIYNKAINNDVINKIEDNEQIDIGLNRLTETLTDFKIIGQVFNTYWIIEKEKKMFIVDQHAAHERVLYEKIKKSRNDKNNSQILLKPIVLNLSEQEFLVITKYLTLFKEFGFEIEEFGTNSFIVRGLPYIFEDSSEEKILTDMLDGLVEDEKGITDDLLAEKIALLSCKAAVKGNNRLSIYELESLMNQLFTLENPYNCPHGRPTIISMTKYELEKKFKRV